MDDLSRYRPEFPVVERRTYLISGSLGPLSKRGRARAEEHLDLWERLGPEELWFEHAFPTNHYVWMAQEPRGARLSVAPSPDGVRVEAEDVVGRIDGRTRLVNVNRVLFESSWIMDLEPIIEAAHDHGAYVVADDFHGSGVVPLDVHALGVDFLVSGALKWLCGGQGIAFLYCRRDLHEQMHPSVVGWFGTRDPFDFDRSALRLLPDARRFETGTYALPQVWTAAAGMGLILEVGVERVRARNQELTRGVIDRAVDSGFQVLSPTEDARRGGLVRVRVPGGREAAEKALHALLERDVVVDQRGDALRISPHFFNDEDDLDRCFTVLRSVV